ncbi:MAG: hypothetical protein J5897_06545, partial [Candidatus Methanomethylophilus sp.]|nr:hypothetical protein [Methanomethylophilus sp.]
MSSLKDVGERQLVETVRSIIRPRSKSTVIGPGDDAAVIRNPSGDIVVSSDVVTKERHLPETMTYEQF